jgi:hypothetical protein
LAFCAEAKWPKSWPWAFCACGKNNLYFLTLKERFHWTSRGLLSLHGHTLKAQEKTMNNNVLTQINDLKTLTMVQLRQRWLVLFTTDPPAYGRAYLERRLAYRIPQKHLRLKIISRRISMNYFLLLYTK